jgi:Zn-dependent protease with chaperone function
MGSGTQAVPYEPYHMHLWYTLFVTVVAWFLVVIYCRRKLCAAPRTRVVLLSLVIALPILSEVGSLLIYYLRPSHDTAIGAILSHIHLTYLERLPIDTLESPLLHGLVVTILMGLGLASLVRFTLGTLRLKALLQLAEPINTRFYGELLAEIRYIATTQGLALPPIAQLPVAAPLAFTIGLLRPRIYLSSGLIDLLDDDELLAVLCHELVHVQRRDNLWNWCVRLLRDITWFVPFIRRSWYLMVNSQDEACDVAAARYTDEPLVLARALVKVAEAWQECEPLAPGTIELSTAFAMQNCSVEARVAQMIAFSDNDGDLRSSLTSILGVYLLGAALLIAGVLPALLGS